VILERFPRGDVIVMVVIVCSGMSYTSTVPVLVSEAGGVFRPPIWFKEKESTSRDSKLLSGNSVPRTLSELLES